jgi:hypothetical protein
MHAKLGKHREPARLRPSRLAASLAAAPVVATKLSAGDWQRRLQLRR